MSVEDTCNFTPLIWFFCLINLLQKWGEAFLLPLETLGAIDLGDLKDPQI